mgnify:CR=1 FL=1
MPAEEPRAVYWDASALVSLLVQDSHTKAARRELRNGSHHLVSSLAMAEVLAVLAWTAREVPGSAEAVGEVQEEFLAGPWAWLSISPSRDTCGNLADAHSLKGADLWHRAAAVDLREELPGLRLLTYDARLAAAAEREGLA